MLHRPTLNVILTILVFAAVLGFVWLAWHVLATFLFAIFFAYLLQPVVGFLEKRTRLSRGKSVAAVYLVVIAGLVLLLLFVGPQIVLEAKKLAGILPDLYKRVASGDIAWQLGAQHGWSYDTKNAIQNFLKLHKDDISNIAGDIGVRLARLGSNIWWFILIPILAIFFLKDGDKLSQSVLEVLERRRQRDFMEGVMNDIHHMLALYIRGQLLLAGVAVLAYMVGLNILRVPYATILGVIAGIWEFIPIAGPLIGALLILGVALGAGYTHLLPLVLFLAAWRGVQDYVISPRIMERQLELHPLMVLFGILAGGELGGIIGVYLSIPVMAAIRILWRRWAAYSRQRVTMTN